MGPQTLILLTLPVLLCAGSPELPQSPWIGLWSFRECWGDSSARNECIRYELRIRAEGGELVADLTGDGFQTCFRIKAKAKPRGNAIQIIFIEATEEGRERFVPGDVLFELVRSQGRVITTWGRLYAATTQSPGVHFAKE